MLVFPGTCVLQKCHNDHQKIQWNGVSKMCMHMSNTKEQSMIMHVYRQSWMPDSITCARVTKKGSGMGISLHGDTQSMPQAAHHRRAPTHSYKKGEHTSSSPPRTKQTTILFVKSQQHQRRSSKVRPTLLVSVSFVHACKPQFFVAVDPPVGRLMGRQPWTHAPTGSSFFNLVFICTWFFVNS